MRTRYKYTWIKMQKTSENTLHKRKNIHLWAEKQGGFTMKLYEVYFYNRQTGME